jgi:hypothetical protein
VAGQTKGRIVVLIWPTVSGTYPALLSSLLFLWPLLPRCITTHTSPAAPAPAAPRQAIAPTPVAICLAAPSSCSHFTLPAPYCCSPHTHTNPTPSQAVLSSAVTDPSVWLGATHSERTLTRRSVPGGGAAAVVSCGVGGTVFSVVSLVSMCAISFSVYDRFQGWASFFRNLAVWWCAGELGFKHDWREIDCLTSPPALLYDHYY